MPANVDYVPVPPVLGSFEGQFDYYIKSWELEKIVDLYVPKPTLDQEARRDALIQLRAYNETIEQLSEKEEEFMEVSIQGINMFRLLSNFSLSIPDITNMNYQTSGRILVWIQRAAHSEFFREKMGYIGTLMSSIRQVNHKCKIVPVIDSTGAFQYKNFDFYNISQILEYMQDIDKVSQQIEENFNQVHDVQFQKTCVTQITQHQRNLRRSFLLLKDYVIALNQTIVKSSPIVDNAWQAFKTSCTQKKCENALISLQQAVMGEDRFRNCDAINLAYTTKNKPGLYKCWRDYMILRSSVYFQSQIMGFVVMSAYEQSKSLSRMIPNNIFVQDGYYDKYVENVEKLVYFSNKCLYSNQGEMIARNTFEPYMQKVMDLNSTELGRMTEQKILTDDKQQKLLLELYLDNFHSDQRWQIKVYKSTFPKYQSPLYSNAAFYWENINGKTILIYTAPALEFFWGKFINDEYRDFDHVKNWKTLNILKKMRDMGTFFSTDEEHGDDHGRPKVTKEDL